VEGGVGALVAGDEAVDGDASNAAEAGRADAEDGVLIEPVVEPGDAADDGEVIEGLFCIAERAVKVAAFREVAEGLTEGDVADDIPGVWGRLAGWWRVKGEQYEQ